MADGPCFSVLNLQVRPSRRNRLFLRRALRLDVLRLRRDHEVEQVVRYQASLPVEGLRAPLRVSSWVMAVGIDLRRTFGGCAIGLADENRFNRGFGVSLECVDGDIERDGIEI